MRRHLIAVGSVVVTGCATGTSPATDDGGAPRDGDAMVVESGIDATPDSSLTDSGDTGRPDAPEGRDAVAEVGPADAPGAPDATEAGGSTETCVGGTSGTCADSKLACLCCPAGGPRQNCACSTPCSSDSECKDPARPRCNHPDGLKGFCTTAEFRCCWFCK